MLINGCTRKLFTLKGIPLFCLCGFVIGPEAETSNPDLGEAPPAAPEANLIRGGLKREVYLNVAGQNIADLINTAKFPEAPDVVDVVSNFETPRNQGENVGQRISGFVIPSESGEYIFYLSADHQAELHLSPDGNPRNKQLIAREGLPQSFRQWSGALRQWRIPEEAVLQEGTLFIEAEDFDFGGGQYVKDLPIGMDGPYPGGAYQDLGSEEDAGIDWHEVVPSNSQPQYRPTTGVEAGKVNNQNIGQNRGKFDVEVNHIVGWSDPGDWMNYTRPFPDPEQEYNIIGRLASGGQPINAQLDLVTEGAGTNEQILAKLGRFRAPAAAGWETFTFIPLLDSADDVAAISLAGERTLRFSVLPGNLDLDYLAFTPAKHPPSTLVPENVSVPIFLEGGQAYYIEAIFKEGTGDDHLAVNWQGPGGTAPSNLSGPISGDFLAYVPESFELPRVPTLFPASQEIRAGEPLKLSLEGDFVDGTQFQWFQNGNPIPNDGGEALKITIALPGHDGIYDVEIKGSDGGIIKSVPATVMVHLGEALNENGVVREFFGEIGNISVAELLSSPKFPNDPDEISLLNAFEAPTDVADNYGQRVAGLLRPQTTGDYTFYLNSDDQSLLFLSTDDTPARKTQIAFEPSWNAARQWTIADRRPAMENVSRPIRLNAGGTYYIEAIMKEGRGGDNLGVAWQGPAESPPEIGADPISGQFLAFSPYQIPIPLIVTQPASQTVMEGETAQFSVEVVGAPELQFRWFARGQFVTETDGPILTIENVTADMAGGIQMEIASPFGTTISQEATLVVSNFDLLLGILQREVFLDIGGNVVADLTASPKFPLNPDQVEDITSFETPPNQLFNYGARVSGFLTAPRTGDYQFFINSDDQSVLFLSTDENPTNKTEIAREPAWNPERAWLSLDRRPNQENISAPVPLEAGRQYYIEALMKQGTSDENLAVTWQLPGDPPPENGTPPIPGDYLSFPKLIVFNPEVALDVVEGDSLALGVNAVGLGPLLYQWSFNGKAIDGATGPTYALESVTNENAGEYSAMVTNAEGEQAESKTQISIRSILTIERQPQSLTVIAGESAVFEVVAAGGVPLDYQWFFNDQPIPGAQLPQLTLDPVQTGQEGNYDVLVSGDGSQIRSDVALLSVVTRPMIASQPAGQTPALNESIQLSVQATGTAPLSYQWRLNGVNLVGENMSTLIIANFDPSKAGSYTVTIANPYGAVTTDAAVILADLPQLAWTDAFEGATLLPGTSGSGWGSNENASRQPDEPRHAGKPGGRSLWLRWTAPNDGIMTISTAGSAIDTTIAVYTGSTLSDLNEVTFDDDSGGFLTSRVRFNANTGIEYLIVVDGFSGAEGEFILSWDFESTAAVIPEFVLQPINQVVEAGSTANLEVSVSPEAGPELSWFFNGAQLPGETGLQLVIQDVQAASTGIYYAEASLGGQIALSQLASIQLQQIEEGTAVETVVEEKFADLFLATTADAPLVALSKPDKIKVAAAAVASGFSGSQIFNTFGAVKELGEPNHCGVIGGASQWFAYQPPIDGSLTIDTEGSEFDTVLAVYTSSDGTFENLVEVACDNDSGSNGQTSTVTFSASADTIYYIAVDGVDAATGIVRLNYRMVVPIRIRNPQISITNEFTVQVVVDEGVPFELQATSDFLTWDTIFSGSGIEGGNEVFDPNWVDFEQRYYRAIVLE